MSTTRQKLPSPTPSLYEHDLNESLNTMTLPTAAAATTTKCGKLMGTQSATSLVPPAPCRSSMSSSSAGPESTRIPRRVKSSEYYPSSGSSTRKPVTAGSSSGSCHQQGFQGCSLVGAGGDGAGVSLDPDVEVWLDVIPLSRRPLRNFHRDFSDGVLMAEILSHFLPKKVDLHNYQPSSSTSAKRSNWATLNQKVLSKLGLKLSEPLIDGITHSKPGYIEKALRQVHRLTDNIDRKLVDVRAKELSSLAASFDGAQMRPPFVEETCLVRNVVGEVPDTLIYQNIMYYGSTAFEDVQRANEMLIERNNELCSKVKRMETLLGLKEAHLNDLTKKIHELRGRYEKSGAVDGGD